MDESSFLDQSRSNDRGRKTPVVVLTNVGLEHMKQATQDQGAAAFIAKPFRSTDLGSVVSDCLGV